MELDYFFIGSSTLTAYVLLYVGNKLCYFAVMLLMTLIHKQSYHMYWSKEILQPVLTFTKSMRCNHFKYIRTAIHFAELLEEHHRKSPH